MCLCSQGLARRNSEVCPDVPDSQELDDAEDLSAYVASLRQTSEESPGDTLVGFCIDSQSTRKDVSDLGSLRNLGFQTLTEVTDDLTAENPNVPRSEMVRPPFLSRFQVEFTMCAGFVCPRSVSTRWPRGIDGESLGEELRVFAFEARCLHEPITSTLQIILVCGDRWLHTHARIPEQHGICSCSISRIHLHQHSDY